MRGTRSAGSDFASVVSVSIFSRSNRAAWVQLAHGLHDAGLEVMKAIEAKSPDQLITAGEMLDTACENCHSTFWYPNAPPRLEGYDSPDQTDPAAKDGAK